MSDEPGPPDAPKVRASDAEREATVERLREATAEGRLTFGELTERTGAAYTATTRGELVPLTADLPEVSSAPPAPVRPAAGADREWVVAVMGDSKRQGRWRVERPLTAVAFMGDVKVVGDAFAEPPRRTLRAWLTRDDRDRRAIE